MMAANSEHWEAYSFGLHKRHSPLWSARITESLDDASNVSHDGFQCPPECISVFCLGQGGVFELTPVPIDSSYALAQEPNALSFL